MSEGFEIRKQASRPSIEIRQFENQVGEGERVRTVLAGRIANDQLKREDRSAKQTPRSWRYGETKLPIVPRSGVTSKTVLTVLAVGIACSLGPPSINSVAGQGQIVIVKTSQSDVVGRSSAEQGALLANIVRESAPSWKCGQAQTSLEKTYDGGSGGWLVQCAEGQDYWVLVPTETGKAATTLPCILARTTTGTNCYANFRTASRDQIAQCTSSPFPDRVIGGCSAVIQSGRLDGRPDALAVAYDARGIGYTRYRQFDLARADFDKALSLNSKDTDGLYNRAVTYERTKDYEKALDDLNVLLRLKPDHVYGLYERGFVYLAKRNYDQAIKDFDETIRLDPAHVTAYRKRGDAYQAKGDTARAQNDFAKARELETQAR